MFVEHIPPSRKASIVARTAMPVVCPPGAALIRATSMDLSRFIEQVLIDYMA